MFSIDRLPVVEGKQLRLGVQQLGNARVEVLAPSVARSCPFCRRQPIIQRWHGGGRDKRSVECINDGCHATPAVIGSNRFRALKKWNIRSGV